MSRLTYQYGPASFYERGAPRSVETPDMRSERQTRLCGVGPTWLTVRGQRGCPRDSHHVTPIEMDRPRLRAVLVDMDGTLVDSEPRHIEAHRRNLAAHGIVSSDEALRANIGLSDRVFYASLSARAGAGGFVAVAPDIDRWLADKTDLLIAMHESEGLSLRPGVEAFLAHVESLALPMYVRAPCSACVRLLLSSTCPHARTRLCLWCARARSTRRWRTEYHAARCVVTSSERRLVCRVQ